MHTPSKYLPLLSTLILLAAVDSALAGAGNPVAWSALQQPSAQLAAVPSMNAGRALGKRSRPAGSSSAVPAGGAIPLDAAVVDAAAPSGERVRNLPLPPRARSIRQLRLDDRNETVTLLKGEALDGEGKRVPQDPVAAGDAFLSHSAELLGLKSAAQELRPDRTHHDAAGRTHIRYQQHYNGVPIWGRTLSLHFNAQNELYLLLGHYAPTPEGLNTEPTLDPAAALAAASADLGLTAPPIPAPEVELVIRAEPTPQLAYRITLTPAPDQRWIYFVEAHSGTILHRIDDLRSGIVVAQGADSLGAGRSFNAWYEGGSYYLIDPSTPIADALYDPLGSGPNSTGDSLVLDFKSTEGAGVVIGPAFYPSSGAQLSGWDPIAVSAAANMYAAYRYFLDTFGRNAMDGEGVNLLAGIHFGQGYNNAFWNGAWLVFGDGDNAIFSPLAGCLDVVAHEMSHGVTGYSANLIYENQSGALAESLSDFFGAMVDRDDWLIADDCTVAPPGFLRSLQDPAAGMAPQPTRMSEYRNLPNTPEGDSGGVHVNGGIPSRAAYLTAEGLSLEGLGTSIGRDRTEQVWYRALVDYLPPAATFLDARTATLQAAEDLYGADSPETTAVAAAWDAVEVTATSVAVATDATPNPTDPVAGEELMFYLSPADGTLDSAAEPLLLHQQLMTAPFSGYDPALDWVVSDRYAFYAKPAACTDGNGTYVLFIGTDNNLYVRTLGDSADRQLSAIGTLWSIAISHDCRFLAYTSTQPEDNRIYLHDFEQQQEFTVELIPTDDQQGGASSLSTILSADAMSFDYTGRNLVFDALNCLPTTLSSCADGGGYRYWSIGFLDVLSRTQRYPFPSQNPDASIGNPGFARNSDQVVLLDYYDADDTLLLALDFQTLNLQLVWDIGAEGGTAFGAGSFWGDDDYVSFQRLGHIERIPLDAQWAGIAASIEVVNPNPGVLPLMHRAGIRSDAGHVTASPTAVDFGEVAVGSAKSASLTLINDGDRDIDLTGFTLDADEFRHNGTNLLLPRGATVTLTLAFTPNGAVGARQGTLSIATTAANGTLDIPLSGTAIADKCGTGDSVRILVGIHYESGDKLSCSALTSLTAGPDITVAAGAEVRYSAPSIALLPGFAAAAGAWFNASQTAQPIFGRTAPR